MFSREAFAQYAALARMRWRIFLNGLRSMHGLLDLGTTGVSWLIYSVFGLGFGTGLCVAAHSIASGGSWQYLPILFWAATFLWLIFPTAVASFLEQADLAILLRFPVRFGSYFLLHLISGLMEASTIVGALCCFGLWLGIVLARRDLYLWSALAVSVFAAFNILLVRAVFAWIDRWLAQRKTREILGAVFMALFVCLLVINSLFNQDHHDGSKRRQEETAQVREVQARYGPLLKTANEVQQWFPPGLGARTLQKVASQESAAGITSLSMLAVWVILAGGTLSGRLKALYRGQSLSWAPSRDRSVRDDGGWTLGGSHLLAALVEKEIRSLLRSVPLLWSVSVPVLFVLVIAGVSHHDPGRDMKSFPYVFPLCLSYALLGFTGLFYNILGSEGAGIQLLFLSPTPIRSVFLAKNLLHSVLFALVGLVACALCCVRLGVPPFVVLADTGSWLIFALPCNLAMGIIFSVTLPYCINPGRISRPAGAQANTLPAALIQLGVLLVGVSVFWFCWYLKEHWLPVPILLALAAGAFFVWMRILRYSDNSANQYRESLIAVLMKTE